MIMPILWCGLEMSKDEFSDKAIYKDFIVYTLTGAVMCVIIDYINHTFFAS